MLILKIRVIELTKASIDLDIGTNNSSESINYIKYNKVLLCLVSRIGLLFSAEGDLL